MTDIEDLFFNQLEKSCDKWYPYFHAYEKHLSKFRNQEVNLLEIGIKKGGSLELWYRYLGNKARIHGVDNSNHVLDLKYDFPIDIEVGDQEDLSFWQNYVKTRKNFDIIIDDGGHTMNQQKNTLLSLFPRLNYEGVYIIEDTHTSYWSEYYNGGLCKEGTFIEMSKTFVDILHSRHIKNQKISSNRFHGLSSVTFYDSMVVLEKEIPKDFKRLSSHNT